jgi:hypothetical protein
MEGEALEAAAVQGRRGLSVAVRSQRAMIVP